MRAALLFVALGLCLPIGETRADEITIERVRSAVDGLQQTAAGINRILNAQSGFELVPEQLARDYEELRGDLERVWIESGMRDMYRGQLSWSVYGAAVAESTLYLGVGAGGEVAWDAPLCRFVGAGLDTQLYRDPDDAGVAYAGFVTACIPVALAAMELSYRPERSVRPRLSARPIFQPGRYSADSFVLRAHNLKYRGDTWEFAFAPTTVQIGWFRQEATVGQDSSFSFQLDSDMFRWLRVGKGFLGEDYAVQIVPLHVAGRIAPDTAQDIQSTSYFISPVRIVGKSLWRSGLYLDFEVGWARGTVSEVVAPGESQFLVDVDRLGMNVGVRSGTRERHWGIHYARLVEPTFEQTVLWDKRLSGWFRWVAQKRATKVEAFAAETAILGMAMNSDATRTGGVSIEQGFVLGKHLHVHLRGDLARSFFAEGNQDLTPEWTYRALAMLSSQMGSTR